MCAQVQVIPNEGVGEIVKLVTGVAASVVENIVVLKDTLVADVASGYAQMTQSADNGLTQVGASTVTTSSDSFDTDTFVVSHPFTASGSETAKGFMCTNSDTDLAYGLCSFASDINVEVGDSLTLTMKWRGKNG